MNRERGHTKERTKKGVGSALVTHMTAQPSFDRAFKADMQSLPAKWSGAAVSVVELATCKQS